LLLLLLSLLLLLLLSSSSSSSSFVCVYHSSHYPVLQSQLAGLNPYQQQPVKDQSENLLPWGREEPIVYNADSAYYKTTHAMLDQFVESRYDAMRCVQ
jgi:hypothetical protein